MLAAVLVVLSYVEALKSEAVTALLLEWVGTARFLVFCLPAKFSPGVGRKAPPPVRFITETGSRIAPQQTSTGAKPFPRNGAQTAKLSAECGPARRAAVALRVLLYSGFHYELIGTLPHNL